MNLITQRSVVQIHPPQPNFSFGFNGLSQSYKRTQRLYTLIPSRIFRNSLRTLLRNCFWGTSPVSLIFLCSQARPFPDLRDPHASVR
jgi:hypothetical protein